MTVLPSHRAIWLGTVFVFLAVTAALAIPLRHDPQGFLGIPWGSSLAERQDLTLANSDGTIKTYQRKDGSPSFADADVEMMQFLTIDDQFARVMIRYRGKANHDRILSHLESEYGVLERIPGQMMRGLNQQYNWRGTDTDINLTYQAQGERGFLSFDSRVLAPRFLDSLPDSSY
ncbi:MAG TPA: hypothetical protein VJ692_10200 [Nitrospiraceae bacterium]|nr:hypothetical protein [Nitrospiraceae bacterium]